EGPEMVPQPPLLDLQEQSGCARVAQILSLPQGERKTGANAPTEKSQAPRSDAKSCHRTLLSPCGRESRSGRGAAETFGPAREGRVPVLSPAGLEVEVQGAQLAPEGIGEVGAVEGEGHVGHQEADLVA